MFKKKPRILKEEPRANCQIATMASTPLTYSVAISMYYAYCYERHNDGDFDDRRGQWATAGAKDEMR
jgi:hypothetical protein